MMLAAATMATACGGSSDPKAKDALKYLDEKYSDEQVINIDWSADNYDSATYNFLRGFFSARSSCNWAIVSGAVTGATGFFSAAAGAGAGCAAGCLTGAAGAAGFGAAGATGFCAAGAAAAGVAGLLTVAAAAGVAAL